MLEEGKKVPGVTNYYIKGYKKSLLKEGTTQMDWKLYCKLFK